MAELANCSRCGKVYAKTIRDICQDCYQEEEEAFREVYTFLKDRKNREATVSEIMEGTGVEEELITKFIREGRLRPSEFPKLSYPCERCQEPIQTGKYCLNCINELKRDLEIHEKQSETQINNEKKNIYVSFNKGEK